MQQLLYCITLDDDSVSPLGSGVAGYAVEQIRTSGLCCLCSAICGTEELQPRVRDTALEFHRVVQQAFEQTTVIPFRFPTLITDSGELITHLRQNAEKYKSALARLRHMVQMEIRIQQQADAGTSGETSQQSGSEYLRDRQMRQKRLQDLADAFKNATSPAITEWRQRLSADKIRCFVLVARSAVSEFKQALAAVDVGHGLAIRVTGPWPPTEFIDHDL
jgi:hypothetical protein